MLKPWIVSTLVVVAVAVPLASPGAATAGVRPQASVTEFHLPHANSRPYTIVTGPDGNLWFTESDRGVDRAHHSERDDHGVPDRDARQPPVRNHGRRGRRLWFTERLRESDRQDHDVRGDHGVPVPTPNAQPWDITALPNGDLWFTEENVDQVAVIHPNGAIDEYPSGLGPVPDGDCDRPGRQRLVHRGDRRQHRPARPGQTRSTKPISRCPPNRRSRGTSASGPTEISGSRSSPAATSARSRLQGDDHRVSGAKASSGSPGSRRSRPATRCGSRRTTRSTSDRSHERSRSGHSDSTTSDYPFGITAGPDGNMWYCAGYGNAIGRMNLGTRRRLLLRRHHRHRHLLHRRLLLRRHLLRRHLHLRHLRRLRRHHLRHHRRGASCRVSSG